MSDVKNGDVEFGKETPEKNNKKTFAIIGGAIVAVVAIILIIVAIVSGGYKSPIKNYYKGLEKADSKAYVKAYPDFMKDDIEDKYDDEALEDMKEATEKEYGDKVKYTYKVVGKIKLDEDDLKDVKKKLEEKYEDEKIKVTAGYEVCLRLKVKGSDEKDETFASRYVYKVNGKWCIIGSSIY